MIGPVLQFDDLKRISGYTRAADVERWADCKAMHVGAAKDMLGKRVLLLVPAERGEG